VVKPSYDLVILAAGIGNRFGGLKQVQPVGPAGELIIEYSVYDALRAGFDRLVFIIRKEMEADFRAAIGRRLESRLDVHYAFQRMEVEAEGRSMPAPRPGGPRTKPWGTGHAVLAARDVVHRPFAVINADDFYGASGYAALAAHFAAAKDYALVGYPLHQTLSEHGAVSRGLCATDGAGRLQGITEITRIEKTAHGAKYTEPTGLVHLLSGEERVSMNFWGFTPAVFPQLARLFAEFLATHGDDPKAEFYLPTAISALNERHETSVTFLPSTDAWFGLTYREDLGMAQAAVRSLVATGKYPLPLWA